MFAGSAKVATFSLYFAITAFFVHSGGTYDFFESFAWVTGGVGLVPYWWVAAQYTRDMVAILREASPAGILLEVTETPRDDFPKIADIPTSTSGHSWWTAGFASGSPTTPQDALRCRVRRPTRDPGRRMGGRETLAEVESTKSVAGVYAPCAEDARCGQYRPRRRPRSDQLRSVWRGWFVGWTPDTAANLDEAARRRGVPQPDRLTLDSRSKVANGCQQWAVR